MTTKRLPKPKKFCNRLYKKERWKYYEKLDVRKITDNKKFWDTIKPFLSNKTLASQKISFKEDDELVTDEKDLNKHFVNSVRCLAEKGGCSAQVLDINDKKDPLDNILTRFSTPPKHNYN